MVNQIEKKRLEILLAQRSSEREWAAGEFDAAQKKVLVDRSTFFDKLILFHAGTIAATITFSGVLHQLPKSTIHWKFVLFISWLALFTAMIAAAVRNWQSQDSWFHTCASVFQKNEGAYKEAYAQAVLSGGTIVDQSTGKVMDATKIRADAVLIAEFYKERGQEHQESADRAEKWRSRLERATFCATGLGVALALAFAMRNFA